MISTSRVPQRPSVGLLGSIASRGPGAAGAGASAGSGGASPPDPFAASRAFASAAARCFSSALATSEMYADTTRRGSPSPRIRPASSHKTSSQNFSTRLSEWVTRRTVLPRFLKSANLSRHLWVKDSSPTARTSSISRTSGSTLIATAKPSRMYMPDE